MNRKGGTSYFTVVATHSLLVQRKPTRASFFFIIILFYRPFFLLLLLLVAFFSWPLKLLSETMSSVPFTEDDLHELYSWIDEIPISRPKRNIARDFSDGCCVAEVLKFFFPKLVDLHNYTPAMSYQKKIDNWQTLNTKVLRKLYFEVPPEEVEDIIAAVPGAVERFLRALRIKISQIKARREELRLSGGENPYLLTSARTSSAAGDTGRRAVDPNFTPRPSTSSSRPSTALPRGSGLMSRTAPSARGVARRSNENGAAFTAAGPAHQAEAAIAEQGTLTELLVEKDHTILELRETVGILTEKIMKLEELVHVKDAKLNQYREKYGRMNS